MKLVQPRLAELRRANFHRMWKKNQFTIEDGKEARRSQDKRANASLCSSLICTCARITRCRHIYLLRARRASLASQGEGAHVPVYGKTKQLNISKTKGFWDMVHKRKNCLFLPPNPFPSWTGPTRPDHDALWCLISRKISSVRKKIISPII